MLNRRNFIKAMGATGLAALAARSPRVFGAEKGPAALHTVGSNGAVTQLNVNGVMAAPVLVNLVLQFSKSCVALGHGDIAGRRLEPYVNMQTKMLGLELDVEIHRYLPHDQVKPTVSLVVGYAGHATTSHAIAHGLPLLMLPLSAKGDQPIIGEARAA